MKLVWKVRRRRVSVQRSGLLIWKCFQQIQTLSQRLKFLRFLIFRYLCKIFGTLLVSFSSIKCNNGGNSTMALSLGGDGGSKMQVLSSVPSEQTFHHFDADLGGEFEVNDDELCLHRWLHLFVWCIFVN